MKDYILMLFAIIGTFFIAACVPGIDIAVNLSAP